MFMLTDLVKQFNWLDLTFIILLMRILYIAQEKGALVELFKVAGVLIGILISFENFNALGSFIQGKLSLAPELINFVCFVALIIFGYFISMVLRDLVLKFVKRKDKVAYLDKIIALVLGALRASLVFSLLLICARISGVEKWQNDSISSYFSPYFTKLSSDAHNLIFNQVVLRLRPEFKPNPVIENTLK